MANMMKMLKQAQGLQEQMQKIQAETGAEEVSFSAGGGMVTATATCDGTLKKVDIDPKVVDPEEVDMLQDLVVAAVQGVLDLGKQRMADAVSDVTKGMDIPGMPF